MGVVVGQTLASDQPSEGRQVRVSAPPRTARPRSCGVIRRMVSLDRDSEAFFNVFFIVIPSINNRSHSGWAANGVWRLVRPFSGTRERRASIRPKKRQSMEVIYISEIFGWEAILIDMFLLRQATWGIRRSGDPQYPA